MIKFRNSYFDMILSLYKYNKLVENSKIYVKCKIFYSSFYLRFLNLSLKQIISIYFYYCYSIHPLTQSFLFLAKYFNSYSYFLSISLIFNIFLIILNFRRNLF